MTENSWEDSNFKSYRKFLLKCRDLRQKTEGYLEQTRNEFLESIMEVPLQKNPNFFVSKYNDQLYYQNTGTRKFYLFDLEEEHETEIVLERRDKIQFLEFKDEHHVYIQFQDRKFVYLYNIEGKFTVVKTFNYPETPELTAMSPIPGTNNLITAHMKIVNEVNFGMETENLEPGFSWENLSNSGTTNLKINVLAVAPRGNLMAWADSERTVKIVDTKTRDELKIFISFHQSNQN